MDLHIWAEAANVVVLDAAQLHVKERLHASKPSQGCQAIVLHASKTSQGCQVIVSGASSNKQPGFLHTTGHLSSALADVP